MAELPLRWSGDGAAVEVGEPVAFRRLTERCAMSKARTSSTGEQNRSVDPYRAVNRPHWRTNGDTKTQSR